VKVLGILIVWLLSRPFREYNREEIYMGKNKGQIW